MGVSEARKRSAAAKGKPIPGEGPKDKPPLQITLLGHEVVLDPFSLTIGEKQTWRRYLVDLGEYADEADHMMALATVIIQRVDPALTWETAKEQITWQVMLGAVAAGKSAETDHPQR